MSIPASGVSSQDALLNPQQIQATAANLAYSVQVNQQYYYCVSHSHNILDFLRKSDFENFEIYDFVFFLNERLHWLRIRHKKRDLERASFVTISCRRLPHRSCVRWALSLQSMGTLPSPVPAFNSSNMSPNTIGSPSFHNNGKKSR
jgi:hypothetical protein